MPDDITIPSETAAILRILLQSNIKEMREVAERTAGNGEYNFFRAELAEREEIYRDLTVKIFGAARAARMLKATPLTNKETACD